jgi:hypothetical protein
LASVTWICAQANAGILIVSSAADAGPNSLRAAVQLANADPPGDVITFATTVGSITITSGQIAIKQNITILGLGPTNLTIVGASPNDRVFEIQKDMNGFGVSVLISEVRFTGGFRGPDGAPGTQPNPLGGNGITAEGGIILNDLSCSLTLSNCVMDACYAIGGNGGNGFGGIVSQPGAGGVGGEGRGGAISTLGGLSLYACTFWSNSAVGGNGGAGTNSLTSFSGSKGGDGASAYGGALYVNYSGIPALTAVNCTFNDDLALAGNGGNGGNAPSAPRAGDGGNGGSAFGGAVYHGAPNCMDNDCGKMIHCTVYQNYLRAGLGGAGGIGPINGTKGNDGAGSGGGLYLVPTTFGVGNTIVAGDGCLGAGSCSAWDVFGTVASQGYNLIGVVDLNSSGWANGACGFDSVGSTVNPVDPRLGPLQYNGGGTRTMAPLSGSPAIDAGSMATYTSDQAGRPRPVIVSGILNCGDGSDIGAYELQCSPDVPSLNISKSGTSVILTWPWPSKCFFLQQTDDLVNPNWIDSKFAINQVGNLNQVNVMNPSGALYFRLIKR